MKYRFHTQTILTVLLFICTPAFLHAQPSNDNCSSAITLTSGSSCSSATYNIQKATNSTPTGTCGGATSTTTYDVWFRFQASATTTTITLSNLGQRLSATSTYIQILSGASCAGFTSLGCQAASSRLSVSGLTVGTFYYIRVYVLLSPTANPANKWDFDICVQHNPVNDDCAGAVTLTPGAACTNTAGTLDLSTANTSVPVGCFAANTYNDVWYKFVATAITHTVTLSNLGANITNPRIQIYTGTCAALVSLGGCASATTTLTQVGLTIGLTYYVRIANTTNPSGSGAVANFNICITNAAVAPANDNCSGAFSLTSSTGCINITGTLINATPSGSSTCANIIGTSADVWYSFIAQSAYPTISVAESFPSGGNAGIEIYSVCGGSPLGTCAANTFNVATQYPTGLTVGTTYYIRVGSSRSIGSPATGAYSFTICITDATSATVDFGKSYINITDGINGGTIDPGDTLEIRATLVVSGSGKIVDSIAYYDTLFSGKGFRLVPGTIALRTNEGKIYRADAGLVSGAKPAFTDAFDNDAGYYTLSGADTAIRINIGLNASKTARGQLSNTSYPQFYGNCIIMATYRVVVNAGYGTKINYGGGTFSTRDKQTGIFKNINFPKDSLMVYASPGLCPNSVSSTNVISDESGGTFGAPSGGTPYAQNRGTSANTNYIYSQFTNNSPGDYYYGIANNTSGVFSTNTTLDKSDLTGKRVFGVWDITGDHTGAPNTTKGNLPCNINAPISATNPCGYMLIVNSAYNTDTAFQYSVSNLCPDTYYEISAWFKNICYKCGADSTGKGASTVGYIPTGVGDSSGIRPNIAFDIDGTDYYTTGNLPYWGTTPTGSDSTNIWVKRGFTIRTGVAQTSFLLTLRNNAPGGGGNDWAIDDIKLATCLPDMSYSPSLSPIVCDSTTFRIYDTVRSYFSNYEYYKWQRSTDNGATWTDVTAALGPTSPTFNGTTWQYVTTYAIPFTNTNVSDSGDIYRVNVATTSTNLSNNNCLFTDGISLITLNIIDCMVPLKSDLLSANGKIINDHAKISWSTSKEGEPVNYDIEKSIDGINFVVIGTIKGHNNNSSEINYYTFTEAEIFSGKPLYRIVMKNNNGGKKYSRTIQLSKENINFSMGNIVNPFGSKLEFDIRTIENTKIDVVLMDIFGRTVKSNNYTVYTGVNSLSLTNTDGLPQGMYILQVKNKDRLLNSQVLKK